jgi:HD superfamily phosphohydrolase
LATDLSTTRTIHDPVQHTIEITPWEWALLSHPVFRRLHEISQTSLNFLVFPGATHTRLDHSLGTMKLAWEAYTKIFGKLDDPLQTDKDGVVLRLAALLHDVGHGPFSHASERFLNRLGIIEGRFHELVAIHLVKGELTQVFGRMASSINKSLRIVVSPTQLQDSVVAAISDKRNRLYAIISGVIDVDRMDYVQRDSFYSGVAFGNVDIKLLLDNLRYDSRYNTFFIEGIDGIKAAEAFLLARDQNYELVNFNPMSRFYISLLERSLWASLREGKFPAIRGKRIKFLKRVIEVARKPDSVFDTKLGTISKSVRLADAHSINTLYHEYIRLEDSSFWERVFGCKNHIVQSINAFIMRRGIPRQIHVYWKDLRRLTQRKFLIDAREWELFFLSQALERELLADEKTADPLQIVVDLMNTPSASKDMFDVRPNPVNAYNKRAAEESLNLLDLPVPKSFYDRNKEYWRICIYLLDEGLEVSRINERVKSEIVYGDFGTTLETKLQSLAEEELTKLESSME